MGFCDWFGDLHSLSADFLQLSIKSGLEALGEHDAAKADETGSGESDKPIMPVMLMSLMVLTILSMVIALSVYSGVSELQPFYEPSADQRNKGLGAVHQRYSYEDNGTDHT